MNTQKHVRSSQVGGGKWFTISYLFICAVISCPSIMSAGSLSPVLCLDTVTMILPSSSFQPCHSVNNMFDTTPLRCFDNQSIWTASPQIAFLHHLLTCNKKYQSGWVLSSRPIRSGVEARLTIFCDADAPDFNATYTSTSWPKVSLRQIILTGTPVSTTSMTRLTSAYTGRVSACIVLR